MRVTNCDKLTGQYKARQGKADQGKGRQGKARQGKTRQGKARQKRVRMIFEINRPCINVTHSKELSKAHKPFKL